MWLVLAPRIRPDARVWPGRRLVSAIDALAWPAGVASCIATAPADTGVVGMVGIAYCGLLGVRRLMRAVFANERYRITTVWLARLVAPLLLVGVVVRALSLAAT